MRSIGKDFSGRITPLFPSILTQKPKKPRRKVTEVPQPSDHMEHVVDEAVYKELDDSLVWAANTVSSLEVEQDSVDTEKKLGPEGSLVTDPTLYRSLAGALQELHLNAMKHVLCYLRGTTDLGLQLFRSATSQLIAYYDADWDTLSHSSAEAEYRGVANAVAETSWIHNLLRKLHTPLFTATLVYCDNVSAIYMFVNRCNISAPNI
nr:ribonuclease H-like domain-containing protein [Tanacetum cinerariifolium]